jgi:aminoglycoside phosphotransferase (APT) family kinase protein
VSPELARDLIETQFPAFAPARLELLGAGWDNTAFRVNDDHVFRFPRRQLAVDLLARENRFLPVLAPRLPLAVPVPTFVGRPDQRFPWPFAGYRLLPGRTACVAALDDGQRLRAAEPIARFLAALHAFPRDEAERLGAGPDEFDRMDLTKRVRRVGVLLEKLNECGLIGDPAPWLSLMDAAAAISSDAGPVLLHGDFYVRHLLVDGDGRLSGVIDWGDLHLGHPAVDLAIVPGFLPPAAHDAFRRAYGDIDADTWQLARFRALDVGAVLVLFGHETGDDSLVREGLRALHQLTVA